MTNYEKLRQGNESIDDVISRMLREKDVCRYYCAVPVRTFIHCQGHRCSDRIRIFLEREADR